jgi:hypothetical protein
MKKFSGEVKGRATGHQIQATVIRKGDCIIVNSVVTLFIGMNLHTYARSVRQKRSSSGS